MNYTVTVVETSGRTHGWLGEISSIGEAKEAAAAVLRAAYLDLPADQQQPVEDLAATIAAHDGPFTDTDTVLGCTVTVAEAI